MTEPLITNALYNEEQVLKLFAIDAVTLASWEAAGLPVLRPFDRAFYYGADIVRFFQTGGAA